MIAIEISVRAGSVDNQVPAYTSTEVWIGSAILLLVLAVVLFFILRSR
ncbi:hypothetical protein ACIP5Y_00500 [Nocardia sp. NPDC088792]